VEQEQVVTVMRCVDCGVSGTRAWGEPTWRYYDKDDLQNNWCLEYEKRWEKEMWDISRGKRMTRQCQACRKDDSLLTKEWSPEVQGWACDLCVEKKKKITSIEREIERLKAKVAAEERDVRRILKPLREIWLEVGIKKLDNHEGVTVKALLDSGATGIFVDKKFVEEYGFKLEKLDRPVEVKNVDRTSNSGGNITHELECNVFYRGHHERLRMDVCNLGRTKMILGMPWLVAHNPEINWESEEVRMSRCPPWCGKQIKQREAKVEDGKDLRWMMENREREEEAIEDRQKVEDMVPKRFHGWLKVFGKQESERILVRKTWDHAIDLQEEFVPRKGRIYPLSRIEREEVQAFVDSQLKKGYIRLSKSPQTLPVMFVLKKDGKRRMV